VPGARIKGEGIRQFLCWYLEHFDEERLAARVAELPEEARAVFDPSQPNLGVVSSTWYPAYAFHALLDAMLEAYDEDQRRRFARDAARVTIERSLKGVYKFLFESFMTPERYARRAQSLFSRFYDTGKIEKRIIRPNLHRSIIRGWTSHHPVLCDVMLYMGEHVYPMLGCKHVKAERISCLSTGDIECVYDVSWK